MKYYICDACKFQFVRTKETDRCPDCGKENICEANETEVSAFLKLQEEETIWEDNI